MDQKTTKTNVMQTRYKKILFADKKEAMKAEKKLKSKYPWLITKVSDEGNLFIKTTGSVNLYLSILSSI